MKNPTVKTRRYLYRLGLAAIGLAVVYGIVSADQGAAWALLLAPLLAMADHNATE